MNVKYKNLKLILASALLLVSLFVVSMPSTASADAPIIAPGCSAQQLSGCKSGETCTAAGGVYAYVGSALTCSPKPAAAPGSSNPAASTAVKDDSGLPTTTDTAVDGNCGDLSKCDFVQKYLNPFINLMAAFVGIAVAISIVVGGIQYSSSAGDPQAAAAAKARIRNALIALLTFIFLYSLLNFLIPGGLLN